jgi:hypothetical protein
LVSLPSDMADFWPGFIVETLFTNLSPVIASVCRCILSGIGIFNREKCKADLLLISCRLSWSCSSIQSCYKTCRNVTLSRGS